MNDPTSNEILIETVTNAWRPRGHTGEMLSHPSWHDLPEHEREAAYAATWMLRQLEAGLDPRGLSTTARAVLDRIPTSPR